MDSASISSRCLRPFVCVRFLVSVYSTIRTTRTLAETIKTQRCLHYMPLSRLQIFLLWTHPLLAPLTSNLTRNFAESQENSHSKLCHNEKYAKNETISHEHVMRDFKFQFFCRIFQSQVFHFFIENLHSRNLKANKKKNLSYLFKNNFNLKLILININKIIVVKK